VNVGDVMDEVAGRVRQAPSLAGRTYAWPVGAITAPAAIVPYPSAGTFDESYGRGTDRVTGALVVAVGRPLDRSTRDRLTQYLDGAGAESIKALVDGDGDYASCDSVTVTGWETDVYAFGDVDYLVAVFALDIYGPGGE
jgi:hypothetical protein